MEDDTRASGAQSIHRAAAVLRAVAASGEGGLGLSDIARGVGLARSTAHRILQCLVAEGLLERQSGGRTYVVGHLVHELALVPAPTLAEAARWRAVVEDIARRTGVTAYLMRRSGLEAVCLVKADGQGVLRFVPVEVGQRRLLGVGAGATALLAMVEDVDEVIRGVTPGLAPYPRITPASLRRAVADVRKTGYAISQGTVVPDGFGLGMPLETGGESHLALSIAAHASIVTESSISAWKRVLSSAASPNFCHDPITEFRYTGQVERAEPVDQEVRKR